MGTEFVLARHRAWVYWLYQNPGLCPRACGRVAVRTVNKPDANLLMFYSQYPKYVTTVVASLAISLTSLAQNKESSKKDEKPPNEAEMAAMMMELAQPGQNHKLLADGVGTWTYAVKMWLNPDPSAPPSESSGVATTKAVMGGRYFISEHKGKMQMPGPDGKMMDMEFNGIATDGYDNVKKKFVSSWIDNMGTGITISEGTYDATTKTLTYLAEFEMMPGMKTKVRQVIKITDKDHHTLEFFEDRGGTEVRTMEIKYTRKS